MKCHLIIIMFLLNLSYHMSAQVTPFEFREHKIKPGEKSSFAIPVTSNSGDSTFIPVTILHGKQKGAVLGLIGGIHGYEYPPIMALQKLPGHVDLNALKGTVIVVHVANVKAFLGRSVYYNPIDGKNLNRTFPGDENGTITEVMAFTLTNQVIARCNYLVDIHAGDANEDLHPYVGYYNYGTQVTKARQMVDALNFPWVIASENIPKKDQPTIYCSATGVARDIPTVAIEYGKLGNVTDQEADFINGRLLNMMKSLGMLPGEVDKPGLSIEINKRISIESDRTGIFYPAVKSGDLIRKGSKLGHITDFFGQVIQEITAPGDGFVIYLSATPPINKGDTLFSIALSE